MKIAVDGYELGRNARGVGRVTHNLLLHLPEIMAEDIFIVYTKEELGYSRLSRARECPLPSRSGYLRWQNGPLRKALNLEKPDIFIAANYVLPLFYSGPSLLIEHDISVVTHPEWYGWRYAFPRRFLTGRSLARARRVIVPSEFIRTEILSRYALTPEKIVVCSWGIEEKFRRAEEEQIFAWKRKKGLAGKIVVGFLGALNRRRHLPLLVQAVELLRKEFSEVVLFLVGSDVGSYSQPEMARILSPEWVRWEEEIAEEELPLFYSSLNVFAFLSEYEGFGFPPLEALACGTPVVLLDRSSLGEIFSGMAFMVENPEAKEVARALASSLNDTLSRNLHLELFNQKRSHFSWKNTAQAVAHLLWHWPSG